ncbi:hypothetical protein QVD17_19731 [Tagetes erecta]|uniref:Reverse transcriptase n=1 Tax=Tagetes erecta TaxID=13708 RepID=A0AAD8KK44_TARER|nr:hypothetical protein QVD17_19731 [Tagetes erecta]
MHACMEKVSLESSGMKGIALMVKNIDGAPIRKESVEDMTGMGSSSKVESQVVGTKSEIDQSTKPSKGSYAGMLKGAANKKIANADPANSKASSSKTIVVTHNSFEALNPSEEARGEVVMETDGTKSVTAKSSQNSADPLSEEDDVEEEASMDEERFLKQKSKVNWLATGDANTSFFHMSLKSRNHKSRVEIVRDTHGVSHEGGEVPKAFVNHYEDFLGCEGVTGDKHSAKVIMDSLQTFASMSRLTPSVQKSTVWLKARRFAGLISISPDWTSIKQWMIHAHSKSIVNIVGKLVIAASAYFVWQERNNRLFKNQTRPPNIVVDLVFSTVRYKLMGIQFKMSPRVRAVLEDWRSWMG